MFGKKKLSENVDPQPQRLGLNNKKGMAEVRAKGLQPNVRKPANGPARAAFGDITNATKDQIIETDKKKSQGTLKPPTKDIRVAPSNKNSKPLTKKKTGIQKEPDALSSFIQNSSNCSSVSSTSSLTDSLSSQDSSFSDKEQAQINLAAGVPAERVEEDISFVIIDGSDDDIGEAANRQEIEEKKEDSLPSVDRENYSDVFNVGIYAQHIFDYYKRREKMFSIPAYMDDGHCRITTLMRAILVDWMVEIQENFELNHETLYLAVKLTDMYLSRVSADKEVLQLIGAASVFIASKFDERCPPLIEDFIYICDNAFDREQFIAMEMEVLRVVDFDLGIPISYRFLRRYAKVARMSMETLTLARYILEISLMEYSLVVAQDSLLAAAALYIAQKMRKEGAWEGEVVKSSGYMFEDIKDLVVTLNTVLHASPVPQLSTIRSKYSHEVFHEVAKIAPLPMKDLL